MRVLLTGAGGYVGRLLLPALKTEGHEVSAVVRRSDQIQPLADHKIVETLSPDSNFTGLLANIDAVIHLADGFNAYERFPAGTTLEEAERRFVTTKTLVECAARTETSLVYLSTIKTMCGPYASEILTEQTPVRPQSLYGQLKLAAEREIAAAIDRHGGGAVCLRFPIVFGTGRRDGNLEKLIGIAASPLPLPFKGLTVRRSLISAVSLVDAISKVLRQQIDGAQTYLIHDGAIDVETLVRLLRQGLGRRGRLFAVPEGGWRVLERSPLLGDMAKRFTHPLELDDGLFRRTFNWVPATELERLLSVEAAQYLCKKVR